MTLAYDPDRVRALTKATIAAIDHLGSIRSHDPAATFALNSVAAARRHLENEWMPLLTDISRSTAMTEWFGRGGRVQRASFAWEIDGLPVVGRPNRFESLSDDDLLRQVYLDGLDHGSGVAWTGPDFADPFWTTLPELAAELARRSADPGFASQLVADAHILPLVAMSVPLARFDPVLVADLTVTLLTGPEVDSGYTHMLHAHALDAAMRTLMHDSPGHALDVLADPAALLTLASWDRLDTELVHDFVRVGLYDSVTAGERTTLDGIGVISSLVEITNGPLDHATMRPGMARGIADSMFGYVHTIAHGIGGTDGAASVFATDEHGYTSHHLGTFADMRDLFGSVLSDPPAAATMGTVLGAYTDDTVQRLGPRITTTMAADDPVKFGLLLDAAMTEEQAEIDIARAADRARQQRLGKAVGFGVGVGLGLLGVPSLVGSLAKELATQRTPADVDQRRSVGSRIGPRVFEGMRMSALADAARNPHRRADYGVADLTTTEWEGLNTLLSAIENAPDDVTRDAAMQNLTSSIEKHLPTADGLLVEVSRIAGMEHAQHGGVQIDTD